MSGGLSECSMHGSDSGVNRDRVGMQCNQRSIVARLTQVSFQYADIDCKIPAVAIYIATSPS